MSIKRTSFIVSTLLLLGIFFLTVSPAEASRLYTTPFAQTFEKDTTQTVDIRLDTQGEAVNAVSAYITYPTDILEVVRIESAATFDITAEEIVDGNIIKLSRGVIEPVFGDVIIATITFKAKTTGDGNLEFSSESAVPNAVDNTDSLSSTNGSPVEVTEVQNLSVPEQTSFMSTIASVVTAITDFLFA